MIFDYETLKLIWWLFVGVLLVGFAITDGFDLGIGALLPFLGRNDDERRVIINSIGATWDGNQVWFITAGGAIFAAWPVVYATAFSGFYFALMLTLFALFFRPVGFDYRSKVADPRWRSAWDWGLFAGGFVPALIFGVAFGNLLQGVPFSFDNDMRVTYTGSFWQLLNPFGLLAGVVSLSMLLMHGSIYLQIRTEGAIAERARRATKITGAVFILAFILAGIWMMNGIDGYRIVSMLSANAASTPLDKVGGKIRRRMDEQLPQPSAAVAGAAARHRGRAAGDRAVRREESHHGIHRQFGDARRRDLHRGHRDVPVHHAVEFGPAQQPDGMGRGVQPLDAADHVLGGADLPAHRAGLHLVGVQRAARQDHGRNGTRQRP